MWCFLSVRLTNINGLILEKYKDFVYKLQKLKLKAFTDDIDIYEAVEKAIKLL